MSAVWSLPVKAAVFRWKLDREFGMLASPKRLRVRSAFYLPSSELPLEKIKAERKQINIPTAGWEKTHIFSCVFLICFPRVFSLFIHFTANLNPRSWNEYKVLASKKKRKKKPHMGNYREKVNGGISRQFYCKCLLPQWDDQHYYTQDFHKVEIQVMPSCKMCNQTDKLQTWPS